MQSTRTGLRRVTRLGLLLTCGLASSAAIAQPVPADPPPSETPPTPEAPPPPVLPQPPQPPVVVTPKSEPAAEPAPDRPTGFSIGIGIGYRFPTSLQTPNEASVRFRLPNAITIEPTLTLASSSREVDVGMTQAETATQVGVGALARFPVISRRRTELEFLGAFGVDRLSQDPNDQNPDDKVEVTTVAFSYGVAVGFWLTRNFQLSLSATNPLVSYAHQKEEMGFGFVSVTNTTTFGLIFDPTVALMVHLYN